MKKKLHAGFTLVEMMIVLLIISVLVLLFIPNLAQEKDTVLDKGNHAIVESMKTQIELQEFSTGKPVTEEYITLPNRLIAQCQIVNFSGRLRPFYRGYFFRIPFSTFL